MFIVSAFGAVVGAAHSAIESLETFLVPSAGSLAPALAIILFTVLVRLAISPLGYLQARAARRQADLAPRISSLRQKHRDDPMTLAAETLALQRANGAGPMAALLPGLAQAPFFMVMYRVSLGAPAGALLGVPLGAHLIAGLPVFALLLALAIALARWSSRRVTGFLRYLPYLGVLAVAWMPLAGALYLVTSNAWTQLEYLLFRRGATTAGNNGQ
jgi:YidC/Oxa1 family membrane protein insertase